MMAYGLYMSPSANRRILFCKHPRMSYKSCDMMYRGDCPPDSDLPNIRRIVKSLVGVPHRARLVDDMGAEIEHYR